MSGQGFLAGLAGSVFVADVDAAERDPARIAATVVGGLVVGAIAAFAALILVLVAWTVASGHGSEGVRGIGRAALSLRDADGRDLGAALLVLTAPAASNVAFVLGFVGLAALVFRRRFKDYVTAAPRVRWRLLLAGLVLSVIAITPLMVMDRLISADATPFPLTVVSPGLAGRAIYVAAAIFLLMPAAAAEEILIRGWLLRQFAAFTKRPGVLIVATGIAFSALHGDFSPGAFLTRALMGAGFAYMTLRLGGVECSIGAHAANNILIVLFVEPLTLKNVAAPSKLTTGSLAEDLMLIAGYIIITEAVARIEPLRRWAGVRLDEIAGASQNAVRSG
ncbi:MAG TPA: type II CAAX endopeptidase family protein [Caulobacteraceae bacterium]